MMLRIEDWAGYTTITPKVLSPTFLTLLYEEDSLIFLLKIRNGLYTMPNNATSTTDTTIPCV